MLARRFTLAGRDATYRFSRRRWRHVPLPVALAVGSALHLVRAAGSKAGSGALVAPD